jgi:outer membrane protein insertion porin family
MRASAAGRGPSPEPEERLRARRRTRPSAGPAGLALGLLVLLGAAPGASAAAEPVRVVVAVLPFRVHSAQPLGHLESSLADLLAARLEASGRVRVVESVVVREALLGFAAGEPTETALRELAERLRADYVVAGSVTELAGHFSLDVRVAPVRAGAPARTLALTASGEEELLERMSELAEHVLSLVAGPSRAPVLEVRVEGAEALAEDPRQRLRLRPGAAYESEAAAADVAALEALPGVAHATVTAERRADGVVVVYRVVPAERILPEAPVAAEGERVAEVVVTGNRRIETSAIRARIGTRAGEPFDPARIAADVREVHALGFFRNVQVRSEASEEGLVITFEVEENPVVRQVTISGNESIDSDKIRDILTLTTGATLDPPLLYENRQRVEGLYRAEGYYLAKVETEVEPLPSDAVVVNFHVDEGKKLRLREIRFEASQHFTNEELLEGLKTKPWHWYSYATSFLDRSGTYSEPVFQQDLQAVAQRYQDAGYIQVQVDEPDEQVKPDGLVVVVHLREGPRFKVGKLDVSGDPSVDRAALLEGLRLVPGEWFDRSALTADVESLAGHYRDRGFFSANVEPQTAVRPDELEVDVTFAVAKGPLYFVREIDVSGNTTTVDPVIRREMRLVEGELYSARAVRASQTRLERLGFFEEVNFEPRQTDQPEQLDLDVKVVEKPTGSISFGAGVSSQDGFVVSGSLAQTNLFGRGYGAQLGGDIGGETDRFFLSFTDPYFLGSEWSLSTTAFSTELKFEDFDESRSGVDLGFGRALDEEGRTRGFLRYGYSARELDQDENVNAASLILREVFQGEETTSLGGIAFRRDTTDDRVLPSSGYQARGALEYAGLGGFSNFARAEASLAWFTRLPDWTPRWFPYREKSSFQLAGRVGYALPMNDIGDWDSPPSDIPICISGPASPVCPLDLIDDDLDLPLTERYFLGGLGTFQLRGFKARSVGPRRAILYEQVNAFGQPLGRFAPLGVDGTGACVDVANPFVQPSSELGECNSLTDKDIDDFEVVEDTDVIGGSKFISLTAEYRFPISEALGLVGILFLDVGNAFDERTSIFEVGEWRYGTGLGGLWFSPFGPLQAFVGFPLDPIEGVEDSVVFEFSVGGAAGI